MLPDNYSGSKFDNRKPSVKRSARHHHQQQRQQRDRFLFCTAVHSLRRERERERENTKQQQQSKEEEKQTIRFVKEGNRNEISLFPKTRTPRTHTNRKRRRRKTKEVNDDMCSLYLSSHLYFARPFWCCV